MSLARAAVSGTLISDLEKRYTPNNVPVTNFTVQVSGGGGKNAQPFQVRVVCWRQLAESVATQLQKGMEVTIDGRLQVVQMETPGGVTKRYYEIDANQVYIGQLTPIIVGSGDGIASGRFNNTQPNPAVAYSAPGMGAAATAPYQQAGLPPGLDVTQGMGHSQAQFQPNPYQQQPMQPAGMPAGPSGDFVTEDDIPF